MRGREREEERGMLTRDQNESRRGLECPRCGCRHFHVLYTRPGFGGSIRRRRECRHCAKRITTYERGS